jgi:Protein of unknown function (DUF5674)
MAIHLIEEKSSSEQMKEMLQSLERYIKLAVDIEQKILAGGGILHADCEAVLLENGSRQENIWGADWLPFTQEVTFESLINIRPRQNNFSMEVEDEDLRKTIENIVRNLMEGISYE